MSDRNLVLSALKSNQWATALELFNFLKLKSKDREYKRLIRLAFPEQDQSIRVLLARLRREGAVISRERPRTVLLEWSLT